MASDKLMRERLRVGTPKGTAVELVVNEIITRATPPAGAREYLEHLHEFTNYARPWKGDKEAA